ncbi:MAG: hypothetical protein M1817_002282 [Caeruleum heppii]|nr:MAG: hypothetical protein M1817_003533 [Caeruleum heppii]KAI9673645.1 MAG: hypothetical protein M1817_002282 [Caeruleum heppii]
MSVPDTTSYALDNDLSPTSSQDPDEIESLPSSPDSSSVASTEDDDSDAERQWRESLQQLELLLTMMVVPYLGKYFGRRCAYWGWAKYMEWMYPVDVRITNKAAFRISGALEAL